MNGILFKFARDWKQIYGGDSNAAKAAGHELLCIRSVLQLDVPDIFTPLMTLVDYAGFRITAVSLLPIDSTTLGKQFNKNLSTILLFERLFLFISVYGSDNGGKTVVSKSAKVARIMEDFARKLNLKAHIVGGVRLFTPGDLEAHHGFDDKDYLVDTSKTIFSRIYRASFSFIIIIFFSQPDCFRAKPPSTPRSSSRLTRASRARR